MALPREDWLHHAKRLAINGSNRVQHGREKRVNMIVKNLPDRWVAYCQSCKEGGVVMKEHVIVTDRPAPAESASLVLPHDMVRVLDAEPAVQDGVLGFLASKNMDALYMPELWFSKSRCRVLVQHDGAWLGRDTTGASPQKWLTFNKASHLDNGRRFKSAVVVEDPFSFYKVGYALRDLPVAVYSSLGTACNDRLMVKLLRHDSVMFYYDGDQAGLVGAERESKRVRGCGVYSFPRIAEWGKDPKDLKISMIQFDTAGLHSQLK